ncbi:uncharacterized protein LOC127094465 [Lathyrus oleraceus]|uniref:uncharacterized protein LOC127094465 n=1 Tax=Pisum sativum TaxID=3888 RepID=UPI0021D1FCAA|nr:uncharacterized protein LOC127094465 [Pisum sativum]
MACTEDQKVLFGTHMMLEEVGGWWDNVRHRMVDKVPEYATKFEELVKFCPCYNSVAAEGSKCTKFESGLRPEIKQCIGYQETRQFSVLVNKCRIYDKDSRARSCHYKSISENKRKDHNCGKPYSDPVDKGKQKPERELHMWEREKMSEHVHISTQCQKPKKAQSRGKVFALSGAKTTASNKLIQDTCLINGIPLISIIGMGETHSFVSTKCVKRLNLEVSAMNDNMVLDTPYNGSVTTSLVCVNCPLTIYDRDFWIDLVCLPLSKLDFIMGMNWLEFNHMHVNLFNKLVKFLEFEESMKSSFMTAINVGISLKESAQVFMVFVSLRGGSERTIVELPVVCEFPEVFLDDISDFSLECELEFAIILIPGTSLVSMDPYRIYAS